MTARAGLGGGPLVPSVLQHQGRHWRVLRAWPSTDGAVLAELADHRTGRDLRAARWTDGQWQVLPYGQDPRLPGLAAGIARGGQLLVHRFGRRAVLREAAGHTKVVRPGRARAVAGRHRAAAAALLGVEVPDLVAVTDDSLTLATLPGQTLAWWGRAPRPDSQVYDGWAATGRWLALSAGQPPPTWLPEHAPADEAAVLLGWMRRLTESGALADDTAARLAALARSTAGRLVAEDSGRRIPAHRDLHDGQLIWDGERLGLIDLDTASAAEPALDIGNLLAHLALRARQWRVAAPGDEQLAPVAVRRVGADLLAALDPTPRLRERIETYRRASALRLIGVYAWRPRWHALAVGWAHELAFDVGHETSLMAGSGAPQLRED